MNQYQELKASQDAELNAFPMAFAFSDKQFEEGMEKLGLTVTDTDKVYKIPGSGFIRKEDWPSLKEMLDRHDSEMWEAINADPDGTGFIKDMFNYELANHEYGYTRCLDSTLDALCLSADDINADCRLLHGLKLACREQIDWFNEHN